MIDERTPHLVKVLFGTLKIPWYFYASEYLFSIFFVAVFLVNLCVLECNYYFHTTEYGSIIIILYDHL